MRRILCLARDMCRVVLRWQSSFFASWCFFFSSSTSNSLQYSCLVSHTRCSSSMRRYPMIGSIRWQWWEHCWNTSLAIIFFFTGNRKRQWNAFLSVKFSALQSSSRWRARENRFRSTPWHSDTSRSYISENKYQVLNTSVSSCYGFRIVDIDTWLIEQWPFIFAYFSSKQMFSIVIILDMFSNEVVLLFRS